MVATRSTEQVLLARRALARPHTAGLLVDGLVDGLGDGLGDGLDGESLGVELADRLGTPLLACPPGSPLERAGEQRRTATLTVVEETSRRTVLFRGRLAGSGRDRVGDREVALVELRLDGVRLAGGDGLAPADVDLTAYLRHAGPGLEEYAALVLAHTNEDHAEDLMAFVSELCGASRDSLAGARLATLDATGISVRWVDLDGAHEVRVLLPERARCAQHLAGLLQQTLRG